MKPLALIALILLIVGGLNWGLWAAFKFDLVATILGEYSVLARVVYGLVGLSAIVLGVQLPAMMKSKPA